MVLPCLSGLAEESNKFDGSLLVLGLAPLGGKYLQTQPVAALRPLEDIGFSGAQALLGAPGVPQVINGPEYMGTIAGAHKLFGGFWPGLALDIRQAAISQ